MHDNLRERVSQTVAAITVGCATALVFAPTPALAITAVPAVYDSDTNFGLVLEIGEKGRHSHNSRGRHGGDYQRHHHHHYGYGPYRPYYGGYYGYGSRPDYYYGGYGYADPYWSPGLSIGFSFSN
jgi:hypothetical protein